MYTLQKFLVEKNLFLVRFGLILMLGPTSKTMQCLGVVCDEALSTLETERQMASGLTW